ncbi:hypothetical protein [Actinoplanes awajinensis]|uniref:Uncharacterized protein n=1 Tax=Actinoplanes awajinensis subsp. mycoplanecinus TaxID=135947 RepID=A0A101JJ51_9ACTN|nr:hypothetical protein [Actinoplanes awajinensis]KUL27830.1 hypothetical protein ADL15_33895 [Actinoplanes awajinensis subsp. mycoplanecinus]
MLRLARCALFAVISLVAVIAAAHLVLPAETPSSVRRQLTHLRHELTTGAAERAQDGFPEGYFFLYALYGLTAVQLGDAAQARWALDRIDSDTGRAPFASSLVPSYGVFYRGWVNWLRGGLLAAQHPADRDPAQVSRFDQDSAAFDASPTPFLAAYPGQAWPVDSTVAIASLRLHDTVTTPRFDTTVTRWLAAARSRLDPVTGLLPHTADVDTGRPTSGARGSSQSMIQRFLPEIDPAFARTQYLVFRTAFLDRPWGLGPAVREYPHGTDGPGDVDSGPLVHGISLSATVVTLGAARIQGDSALSGALATAGDVFGVPIDTITTRRYVFGVLPIGDAFLAWAKSARPLVAAVPSAPPAVISWWWRLPLLAVFLLLGAAPWLTRALLRRRATRRPSPAPG